MRGRPIHYSDDEMAWLEANRTMIISDYHCAFVELFRRNDISALNLHGLRKRKGWFVGRAPGRFYGRHRKFSTEEMNWLRDNADMVVSDYCREFCTKFGREDVYPRFLHALRKRKGWKTGRTGCFEKGMTPVNKGKRCPPGKGGRHPNARKTQFKKGGITGAAAEKYKPIGTERFSKEGYLERKVHDGLPRQSRWQTVQKIRWEDANGQLPVGMALKCINGDRLNTDPSNWEAVPRAMLPRLNGKYGRDYDHAPTELKPIIMATAKLEHRAREVGARKK